jgi:hypothetical protein
MVEPLGPDEERAALDLLLRGFQVSRVQRVIADLDLRRADSLWLPDHDVRFICASERGSG